MGVKRIGSNFFGWVFVSMPSFFFLLIFSSGLLKVYIEEIDEKL